MTGTALCRTKRKPGHTMHFLLSLQITAIWLIQTSVSDCVTPLLFCTQRDECNFRIMDHVPNLPTIPSKYVLYCSNCAASKRRARVCEVRSSRFGTKFTNVFTSQTLSTLLRRVSHITWVWLDSVCLQN